MTTMTTVQALNSALQIKMAEDKRVFCLGEDLGWMGGDFGVTRGLFERFGGERVRDTPLSEAAIIGTAVGSAMVGMRPVADIVSAWGGLDIWVHNAGIFDNTSTLALSEEVWDRVSDVNYKAMFLCSQAAVPHRLRRGWGRIVNLSSMAGKVAFAKEIAYCSTKAAVLGLTRALAVEFGPGGVTRNAICPGPIETDMVRSTYQALADENGVTLDEWYGGVLKTIPAARFGQPEDVAALVAFLVSPEARLTNGQSINVDGGIVFS